MQMPWFKLFHEARTDPKLRALSRDQHYVWFNLLCYANEQAERGLIRTMDDEVLACAVADGDVELLRSSIERLVKLQLIDRTAEGLTPHGWSERQAKVDTTSAERSKRWRERHKAPKSSRKTPSRVTERDATRDERVTSRPVTETSRYRDREREEERNTPLTPNGGKSEQPRDSRQPISIEAEPFDSGQSDPLPKALPPKATFENDPAEIARLVAKAESIFRSNFDVGMSVHEAAGKLRADWIDEALDIAREKNAQGWAFVRSVFTRFKAQGMSDSEKQARDWDKKQKTSLWNQPSHVPEPDPRRPKMRSINALSESEILEFRSRGVA